MTSTIFNRCKIISAFLSVCAALNGQAPPAQLQMATPAPSSPQPYANVVGNQGNAAYAYYLVTNYAGGSSISIPAVVQFAPAQPTTGNYVQISWPQVSGAATYDVVKVAPNTPFNGNCSACLLTSGLTVTSTRDTGASLTSYAANPPVQAGNGTLYVNSRDYASPQLRQIVNGVDLPVAGSLALTNQAGTYATIPATCANGQLYFATDQPAGQNIFGCVNNVWTLDGSGMAGTTGTALQRNFKAAEAKLLGGGTAPIHIALVGDSWSSNGFITYAMQQQATALYPPSASAGTGFIPSNLNDRIPDGSVPITYTWSRAGTWTDCGTSVSGVSNTCIGVNNADASSTDIATPGAYTITDTATDFRIFWYRQSGGGSFIWQIDGGGATTVSTSGATGIQTTSITGLSNASHTLKVTVTVAGTGVRLAGFESFISGVGGVIVSRVGQSGSMASDWASANQTVWSQAIAALNPDAILTIFGTNEQNANQPPATQATSLNTLYTSARTGLPLVDWAMTCPANNNFVGKTYTMSQYCAAQQNLALSLYASGTVNLVSIFGTFADANSRGLMQSNGYHLNQNGANIAANAMWLNFDPYIVGGKLPSLTTTVDGSACTLGSTCTTRGTVTTWPADQTSQSIAGAPNGSIFRTANTAGFAGSAIDTITGCTNGQDGSIIITDANTYFNSTNNLQYAGNTITNRIKAQQYRAYHFTCFGGTVNFDGVSAPVPSATNLGGVFSDTTGGTLVKGINTDGTLNRTNNLSGTGKRPVCTDANGDIYAGTNTAGVLACP